MARKKSACEHDPDDTTWAIEAKGLARRARWKIVARYGPKGERYHAWFLAGSASRSLHRHAGLRMGDGWGTEGHSIIAEIAQREMSRPTRDAVDELLGHATLELR
jgi:hypothetical protein